MATITKGNPYTHYQESRTSHRNDGFGQCAWCGNDPKTLYSYNGERKQFCNKDCRRSYYN